MYWAAAVIIVGILSVLAIITSAVFLVKGGVHAGWIAGLVLGIIGALASRLTIDLANDADKAASQRAALYKSLA